MKWYVATLASYVLVEAGGENEARAKGQRALHELYSDVRDRLGQEVPINIRTVRSATDDEVELCEWHEEMVAREAARNGA